MKTIETVIERILFASRWLLTPMYLGMTLLLVLFAIKFFQELIHLLPGILEMAETDLILVALALIDLTLVANLIIMVIISGYENFVSRIDLDAKSEKLSWVGKLDSGTLKLKVAASIVAISSIHLLKAFMNVNKADTTTLMWLVIIHMTFVVSALLLAWLDKMAFRHDH